MIIPHEKLDADIFNNMLQELATREGTDYGLHEATTEEKIAQLKTALLQKQCFIVFEELAETIGIITRDEATQLGLL